MKKLIILLIALIPVVSLSASSKLKVIEGNTAFLKLSPSKIRGEMGLDKLSLSNSAKNVDNQASVIIKMCGTTLFVEGGIYTSFSPGLARWEREYCNLLVRILQSMSEQYLR